MVEVHGMRLRGRCGKLTPKSSILFAYAHTEFPQLLVGKASADTMISEGCIVLTFYSGLMDFERHSMSIPTQF